MIKTFFAALLVAIAASDAAAAEPRKPAGRWVVNFDDAQCVATRDYGTSGDPLFLVLKAPPLGNVIQFGVISSGSGTKEARQLDAQVRIDQRKPLRTSMLSFANMTQKQRAYLINLPISDFAPARQARSVSIRAGGELNETFEVSALEPLMKVVDTCVADLRRHWNVGEGEAIASNLRQGASGNLQGLFEAKDYPAVAIEKGQSGAATLALLVDEKGKVADCTVIGTSGAASLDAQSCGILKRRAKFNPAIGLDGKPTRGSFIQRITWRVE